MNYLPLLLGALALFTVKPQQKAFFSDPQLLDLLAPVAKLMNGTPEEKNAAFMEVLSHPKAMELLQNLLQRNTTEGVSSSARDGNAPASTETPPTEPATPAEPKSDARPAETRGTAAQGESADTMVSATDETSPSTTELVPSVPLAASSEPATFTPQEDAAEHLFRPVAQIAGVQLTEELKKLYRDWYLASS